MECRKCTKQMVKQPNMFYWRGDYRPGWTCDECKSLWPVEGDEIEPLKIPAVRAALGVGTADAVTKRRA